MRRDGDGLPARLRRRRRRSSPARCSRGSWRRSASRSPCSRRSAIATGRSRFTISPMPRRRWPSARSSASTVGVWIGGLYTELYADVLRIPGLRYPRRLGNDRRRGGRARRGRAVGRAGVGARRRQLHPRASIAARHAGALSHAADRPARHGDIFFAAARMVLRGLERRPSRAMLGAAGVAAALAMMAGALSLYDASWRMIDVQFRIGHRETLGGAARVARRRVRSRRASPRCPA